MVTVHETHSSEIITIVCLSFVGDPHLWIDGTDPDFIYWAPGEPNDEDGSENCVEMIVDTWPGMWNDHDCMESRYYVCKADRGES
jgi:hypothetical protein